MMRQEYYPDRIYGFDEYETVARRKNEAEKGSRKDKNGKNRQK